MNTQHTNAPVSVMILDDGADFRQTAKEKLTAKGFHVTDTTQNARQALEIIRVKRPDVVIFDIILSQTDGIAFLKEAQKSAQGKTLFIVASSVSSDIIIQEAMRLGASYYMAKPVDFDVLAERLEQICAEPAPTPTQRPKTILPDSVPVQDLEGQVTSIILEVGIPAHVKGYHYVRSAILLAIQSPDTINAVTKIIYPTIAKQYATSASRVERAIRHAIEVAWDRGNVDTLNGIFGYSVNSNRGKPTNSEFIAMIADRLRLKNKVSSPMPAYRF